MKTHFYLIKTLLFIWLLSGASCILIAQNTSVNRGWSSKPFERKVFIENKGQFAPDLPEGKKNYNYLIDNGSRIFFYKNELLFYFSRPLLKKEEMGEEEEDEEEERERERKLQQREKQFISMKWLNSNPDAIIEVEGEQPVDYGYILKGNKEKNYTAHCKGYKSLKIKGLYPGIDVEYFFNEKEGFKYNLYASPGADLSKVQQQYDGMNDITLLDGNIIIKTILGDITDHAPVSHLANNRDEAIPSSFFLKNHTVSFQLAAPDGQAIIIDPWVTPPTMSRAPVDNGVDQYGNVYVTSPIYILEKYSPTGTLISSTDVMGGTANYYGDMLTDSRGYCFFNTVGFHPRGDASAVDSAGNFLWDSFGINECWRFVLNECTSQVLSLTGYRHSSTGFARINTETGALTGYNQSGSCCQDPHCGAIDYNGDVYCVVSENGGGTAIYKWTPANTIAATYPAVGSWGYGTGYVGDGFFSQGYNGMTILGNNLYIYDGATLFKVNKTNGSIVSQVTVPGGVNKQNGGIYITSCGKVFVGSGTGVYMYDMNFNQVDFKATSGPVFDLAFNAFNQTISVCGPGHVTELAFVIPPCTFQTQPFIQPSCGGLPNGYIKLNLTGGVPDYTYSWSSNGVPLSQITDSIGGLVPGTYKCVYSDNKCPIPNVDSTELTVVAVTTTAAFTSVNVCDPLPVAFTDSSTVSSGTIVAWDWKFGDSNSSTQQHPSHLYANDGTYSVKLAVTTSDGCKDSITQNAVVHPKPEADFSFTNKCQGSAVPLSSTSTINSPGAITSWNWALGDNSTDTGNSISHLYSTPGDYNVTLVINSGNSCSDTATKLITVFNNPVASFTYADVCLGDSMHFINTSTVNLPAVISNYLWNFGNGSTSIVQNPSYKYSVHGSFNAILVTTTADGCSDAAALTVKVFDPPAASFTVNNVCLFDSAVFNNTTTNPTMGTVASWQWDFGDGSAFNTTSLSPHHRYANTGNYGITLIARSSNLACADTITDSITVFPMPVADYSSVDVCLNETMYFYDSSEVVSGGITSWEWTFGDNSPSNNNQQPTHLYQNHGSYNVVLISSTNNGCKDTIAKTVVVHPLPLAQFSTENVCHGTLTPFTDLSTIPSPDVIQTWQWDFGDNSTYNNNQNCTHLYSAPGPYLIELLVVSQFGCADSVNNPAIVNPNPEVNFLGIDSVGCEPLCVNFENLSTIATGNNTSWLWNFGNGSPVSSIENASYCYTNDSIYSPLSFDVTLTVTSDEGCTSFVTKANYITVYPLPIASFTVQPSTASIIDPVISVTDLSIGANTWLWNFGESDSVSLLSSPLPYTYSDTGTYTIMLITNTQYNCKDTSYQNAVIEPNFLFYIPSGFSPNGDGLNDSFTGKGIFIKEFEMFIHDRWGNLVYYTDEHDKPWDGTINYGTEIALQDVYIYTINIKDYTRKKHNFRGTVTLVR